MTAAARKSEIGLVLLLYLGLSVAYFGWPVLADPRHYTVGSREDPDLFVWFLAWWPHAIGHGLNPFHTTLVWAPDGLNLAWTTSVPTAALLLTPVTLAFGPVVAFNVAALLAPALAAWTAYLLCRHITAASLPAVVGGYLFGFSSYELAHLLGHLNLSSTAFLPLLMLVGLRYYERRTPAGRFVVVAAVLLAAQFGLSTEIFATATFWGVVALLIALALNDTEGRRRLLAVGSHLAAAYGLAAVILAPYIYYVIKGLVGLPALLASPITYSADLLNYVVPTPLEALGGRFFAGLSSRFSGNYTEADAYLGLPLLLIVVLYAIRHWPARGTKTMVLFAAAVMTGSLGPLVHVAGTAVGASPWALTVFLPLIRNALPARFALYITLVAAVIVALWLAERRGAWLRYAVAGVALICIVPNVAAPGRYEYRNVPPFFASGGFRQLARDQNAVVIPYGYAGDSMLWHAETRMSFPMSGGWLGPLVPLAFSRSFVTYMLYAQAFPEKYRVCLEPFLADHHVRVIVVAGPRREAWQWLKPVLRAEVTSTGGVTLYRVPSPAPADAGRALVCRGFLFDQFNDLVNAGKAYAARRDGFAELTPRRAEELGLLAPVYGGYEDTTRANWTEVLGWLGPWGSADFAAGVLGSTEEVAPIIKRYRKFAKIIYFPYPSVLQDADPPHLYGRLLIVFPGGGPRR